jgi:hypothetical protein
MMNEKSINPFGNVLPRHSDAVAARDVEILFVDTQPEGLPHVAEFALHKTVIIENPAE